MAEPSTQSNALLLPQKHDTCCVHREHGISELEVCATGRPAGQAF
jgi:hypothetical protein